ncbi:MAG: EAL domain-containing protein [Cohaesibacteraceae bacterium]|nr:EAL domain-containing protein [Cohaesibacteraceae bacterium]
MSEESTSMQLRFWTALRRSLRARFLFAFSFGAIIVTIAAAWATFNVAESHLQNQLVNRAKLLSSTINHTAMVVRSDSDLQHIITEIRKENPDIGTIAVLEKNSQQLVAISRDSKKAFNPFEDPHLWGELNNAVADGSFGSHVENNLELVTIFPLFHAMDREKNRTQTEMPHDSMSSQIAASSDQINPSKNVDHQNHGTAVVQHGDKKHSNFKPMVIEPVETRSHANHQLDGNRTIRGGIILHLDRKELLETRAEILERLIPTTILGILVMVALAWLILQSQVIDPIADIRDTMKRQQSGKRAARARPQSTDEFNDVANSFNGMIEAMASREDTIKIQAYTDSLTELPNRKSFNQNFQKALENAEQNGERVTLAFLDLDHFKTVNDTKGHVVGDELLKVISKRISACIAPPNMVARLGGDEFAIILVGDAALRDVDHICEQVINTVCKPVIIEGADLIVGVSIGISHFPQHATDQLSLIKYADLALYQVKDHQRGSWKIFDKVMGKSAEEAHAIELDLRMALERDEFFLEYQPQVSVQTGELTGVEALIRWKHPTKGIISPELFIKIAESSGLIDTIGNRVLIEACHQAVKWAKSGIPPMTMGVNISSKQLQDPGFVEKVDQAIKLTGVDPRYLELELTETAVMACSDEVIDTMYQLGALGVRLAIDDFGTGHSSLSRLKHFPLDRLKIDRSFIDEAKPGSDNMAITCAIIQLAKSLKMNVIAEGVETVEQFNFLVGEGCDDIQGFLFGKPMAEDVFINWLTSGALAKHTTQKLREIANQAKSDHPVPDEVVKTGNE